MVYVTSGTLSVQERRSARLRLTEEFIRLLEMKPEDNARWNGTTTDLVEVAHIAYESGRLYKENGTPLTFTELVTSACRILHLKTPSNPRRTAYQARNRKGTRQKTFLERYCMLLYEGHVELPLQKNIMFNRRPI